jgi:hypothetical protein
MSKQKKNKLEGKFVVVWDTMCDGNQCQKDEHDKPLLFDSYGEAFAELFDGACAMLTNRSKEELKEYNEGVTQKMVKEMNKINDSGDHKAMEAFLNKYPQCNDNEEWVEKAEDFIDGKKLIFGAEGAKITGKKLK